LKEEEVMQSSVYQLGEQRGKREGREETILRLYERRLGRPLREDERATLLQRLETLGAERLLDLPLTLSADALEGWLGEPTAR
jgi:hypothetical protein